MSFFFRSLELENTSYDCFWLHTGFSAYYISCHNLVETLIKSKEQNRFARKLKWFAKPNLLRVDEAGFEPLSAEQTYVLFQLINMHYETGVMIMIRNKTMENVQKL